MALSEAVPTDDAGDFSFRTMRGLLRSLHGGVLAGLSHGKYMDLFDRAIAEAVRFDPTPPSNANAQTGAK